ncbi:DUF383-domain-containing protein [Ascobolus immersus RN42]|uniref:Protein HGH1 homolog n=1 Tax=Ascobolus immersus RN42 TaxID=1160509 RepID=A0A3N4H7H3_ASCIM|nr:DUF383-domain-containing protein [Ascobolus immersus RN42]
MPTELEELVTFLAAPNPQARQLALEHAVGYTTTQPQVFKQDDLRPIKDLKVTTADIPPRAKHALTCLVNLSDDQDIKKLLAEDDKYIQLLLEKITDPKYSNADLVSMLLANLSKSDAFVEKLLTFKTVKLPAESVSKSHNAMDQLMDLFVKGADQKLNPEACYDFLAYVFADVARIPKGREFFTTAQAYDGVIPLQKLIVFTEHSSLVRRKGVASCIKNSLFDTSSHRRLLDPAGINLLPYILLPLCGPDCFSVDENMEMLDVLQFLPEDKKRETDPTIVKTWVECLQILAYNREGRDTLRAAGTYYVIRELHLVVGNEDAESAIERLVDFLQADEPDEGEESEDDDKIEEIV